MDLSAAIQQWQLLLGRSRVLLSDAAQAAYGNDTSAARRHIAAALLIESSAQLQEVMRIASQHQVPVYPISTGHNWGYGTALPARDNCAIIDLSALVRIIDFDQELGVVTLEPGVTQGMLATFLDAGKHPYLVPVTGAGPSCSLIGNALERGYGVTPYTDHFGAVTDLEAVLPDGSLYRTALREAAGEHLARLFKWGIGPYSAGLFAQGGFGIVTRMSIALSRRPECIKACFFGVKDEASLEHVIPAIRALLTQLPGTLGGINLMNQHRVLSMSAPFPADTIGPNGLVPQTVIEQLARQHQVMPWTGFATLYGTKRMMAAAQKEMKMSLSGTCSRIVFLTSERIQTLTRIAHWIPGVNGRRWVSVAQALGRALELVAGRPNETALPLAYWRNPKTPKDRFKDPSRDGCGLIWYAPLVPMRAADVRAYLDMVLRVTHKHGIEPLITMTSISDKLFDSTVPLLFDRNDPRAEAAAQTCYQELLMTGRTRGWFPYRIGVDSMPTFSALLSDSKVFHSRLRKDLDPFDLMAPGRYR